MSVSEDNPLATVAPLTAGRFSVAAAGDRGIALAGELASRDPAAEFGAHFRRIHDVAAGGGELTVDLTGLAFVNSSGLRIFLDWVGWIAQEPEGRRYRLKFRTKKGVTWQAAALPAIAMLGGASVSVEPV